ncbi:MAG: cell division protein FtsH, partial [Chloroflexi bacterium]|nr:cell division protein FtsH [Chloroflexota bacterium]
EKLGPMVFGQKEELVFLGREIGEQRNYSEAVARQIDHEVSDIIERAYAQAKEILTTNSESHHRIARRLIEVETIEREEFAALLAGRPEDAPKASPAPARPRAPEREERLEAKQPIEPQKSGRPQPAPAPI